MDPVTCPGCGAEIDPGVSICPKCDHILDTSFLEGAAEPPEPPPAAATDATNPRARMPAPPPGRSPTGAARKVPGRAPTGARPAAPGAKPRASVASRIKVDKDEGGATPPRGTRAGGGGPPKRAMPEAPPRQLRAEPAPKRDFEALAKEYGQEPVAPREAFQVQKMTSAEEAYAEAKDFMGNLASSDKLALVGIGLVILVSFFPWKVMATEGEVLGLLSLGVLATCGAALAGGALYARVQRLLPNINPVIPWFAQLGAICFVILWCLIYIKISWDGTMVPSIDGNVEAPISKPDVGVYAALMSSLLALGGTLMGLKEQQPR